VYPAAGHSAEGLDTRPIAEVLAEIAAAIPAEAAYPVTGGLYRPTGSLYLRHPQAMKQVLADTLYWVACITPGDSWYAPMLQAVAALGQVDLVTTEEVLGEFLSAYDGRGAYLRQEGLKTVQALFRNLQVTVLPQTHESFMKGLDFYASRTDKCIQPGGLHFHAHDVRHGSYGGLD
jgi:hypothetical protein